MAQDNYDGKYLSLEGLETFWDKLKDSFVRGFCVNLVNDQNSDIIVDPNQFDTHTAAVNAIDAALGNNGLVYCKYVGSTSVDYFVFEKKEGNDRFFVNVSSTKITTIRIDNNSVSKNEGEISGSEVARFLLSSSGWLDQDEMDELVSAINNKKIVIVTPYSASASLRFYYVRSNTGEYVFLGPDNRQITISTTADMSTGTARYKFESYDVVESEIYYVDGTDATYGYIEIWSAYNDGKLVVLKESTGEEAYLTSITVSSPQTGQASFLSFSGTNDIKRYICAGMISSGTPYCVWSSYNYTIVKNPSNAAVGSDGTPIWVNGANEIQKCTRYGYIEFSANSNCIKIQIPSGDTNFGSFHFKTSVSKAIVEGYITFQINNSSLSSNFAKMYLHVTDERLNSNGNTDTNVEPYLYYSTSSNIMYLYWGVATGGNYKRVLWSFAGATSDISVSSVTKPELTGYYAAETAYRGVDTHVTCKTNSGSFDRNKTFHILSGGSTVWNTINYKDLITGKVYMIGVWGRTGFRIYNNYGGSISYTWYQTQSTAYYTLANGEYLEIQQQLTGNCRYNSFYYVCRTITNQLHIYQ